MEVLLFNKTVSNGPECGLLPTHQHKMEEQRKNTTKKRKRNQSINMGKYTLRTKNKGTIKP